MNNSIQKQKNLNSQLKRINKRTAIELFCVVIVLSKGYYVDFRKPRYSTKSKPFLLINRIFNKKEKIFDLNDCNIDEMIEHSYQHQKEKLLKMKDEKNENIQNEENVKKRVEIKEIRTSIVMNKLIEIIREKRIKPYTKRRHTDQELPQFQWLSSVVIDNNKYTQKEIVEIGELMFDFIDYSMEMDRYYLVFDYDSFIKVINPSKDKKLVDFFNLMEHRRKWVYQLVDEEKIFKLSEDEIEKENQIEEIEINSAELNEYEYH